MPEEKDPIVEAIETEIWLYESGNIQWAIRSKLPQPVNKEIISELLLETAETFLAGQKNSVVASVFFQENGIITTRWVKGIDFSQYKQYLWLRNQLFQAQWYFIKKYKTPNLRVILWSIQWFWYKISGQFRLPQYAALPLATPVAANPVGLFSEQSEGPPSGSEPCGGNVVPFRRGPKHDDLRPL